MAIESQAVCWQMSACSIGPKLPGEKSELGVGKSDQEGTKWPKSELRMTGAGGSPGTGRQIWAQNQNPGAAGQSRWPRGLPPSPKENGIPDSRWAAAPTTVTTATTSRAPICPGHPYVCMGTLCSTPVLQMKKLKPRGSSEKVLRSRELCRLTAAAKDRFSRFPSLGSLLLNRNTAFPLSSSPSLSPDISQGLCVGIHAPTHFQISI